MDADYRIFKRKLYERMLNWKQTKDGKTALLIKGARRVGKSTIAEEFAKREYDSYIVVDFANAPDGVWEAVKNIANLDNFFFQLQFIYKVKLAERKSVIIFDEIQNTESSTGASGHQVYGKGPSLRLYRDRLAAQY